MYYIMVLYDIALAFSQKVKDIINCIYITFDFGTD